MNRSILLCASISCCFAAGAVEGGEPVGHDVDGAVLLRQALQAPGAAATISFKNVKSGRCIGVDRASTSSGAYIKQFTCDGARNQYWTTRETGQTGIYNLVNLKSGKCMGVDRASTSAGANIRQFNCDSSANQRWFFVEASGSSVRMVNFKSRLCIGVDRASVENGAQLKQFRCDGRPNQSWIF